MIRDIALVVIAAMLMIVGAMPGPEPRRAVLHLADLGLERVGFPASVAAHSI